MNYNFPTGHFCTRLWGVAIYLLISRARKIVTKFHNYSYEIVMSPVIVNSYKNGHNSYQIVK